MGRREIVQEAPDAEAYVRDAEPLREEIRERQRRKACVKDVNLVRVSDFSNHHLSNDILFEQHGKGPERLRWLASKFRRLSGVSPATAASAPAGSRRSPGLAATASHVAQVRAFCGIRGVQHSWIDDGTLAKSLPKVLSGAAWTNLPRKHLQGDSLKGNICRR